MSHVCGGRDSLARMSEQAAAAANVGGVLLTRSVTANEASRQRLFSRHEVARQNELHGARLAQGTREALRAAQARDGAQLDLRLPAVSKNGVSTGARGAPRFQGGGGR